MIMRQSLVDCKNKGRYILSLFGPAALYLTFSARL